MRYLLLGVLLALMSCASAPAINLDTIHHDALVTCVGKLDHSKLVYLKSMRHDYPSKVFPTLTISNIVDIEYKPWTINTMEWSQYTCTEKIIE